MDEDLNLDLDLIENDAEKNLKVKNRFQQLSEKVIITSKERDDANSKAKAAEDARMAAEKERDFHKGFSKISAQHPEAINYQDQILERVNKGYDPEEAALAVLAKEGKLANQFQETGGAAIQARSTSVEGGSAGTTIHGAKSPSDMSHAEKYDALSKLSASEIMQAFGMRG